MKLFVDLEKSMFIKLKELIRESYDLCSLNKEFMSVCPDAQERKRITKKFKYISQNVSCPHNMSHILTFVIEMMRYSNKHSESEGIFVEAGSFKGGSTAKFSLVAKSLNRKMVIYDSFEGIPENTEEHQKSIFGYSINNWFYKGAFKGDLEVVKNNVKTYGDISVCSFVKGWFQETMKEAESDAVSNRYIAGAYIDVDLALSTKYCLQYLYPRLLPDGFLVSQDGDFPLVIDVFNEDNLWKKIGYKKPKIHGLGTKKMLTVYREEM